MDFVQLIETLGIPVAVACVLGYACLYLMKFITNTLVKRIDEQFSRLEGIVIKLIDSNNKEKTATLKHSAENQAQFSDLLGRFDTFITVFQKYSGNGFNSKHD
tara:strand:- start:600 stop:908 length:309 start_codon:yes stop_codon:yes gene_type:complete